MYIKMSFVAMMMLLLQYDQGYSTSCTVDPTSAMVDNAALNKSASQISDYSLMGVASNAVDGDNNPEYVDGSCMHTKYMDPRLYRWWMVDLERVYRIDSLNITNRAGGTAKKMRDFDIFVSLNSTFEDDDHMTDESLCIKVSGEMGSGETRTFTCQTPVFGQFVQIYMETPDKRNMHICEVTVQGYQAMCVEDTSTQSVPSMAATTPLAGQQHTSTQSVPNMTPTAPLTGPQDTSTQSVHSMTATTPFNVPEDTTTQSVSKMTPSTWLTASGDTTTQSVSNMTHTIALTVPSDTSTTAPPMCLCWCNASSSTNQNLTQEELVELVKELAKELTVNKKETSMSKRKLISVGDERQSAETIGFIGVLALCVPVLLIVSFDLINLWSSYKQTYGRKTLK